MRPSRRRLLACLPAALAPAALASATLAPGAAGAFRLEPASAAVAAGYVAGACPEPQTHEALRAELDRALDGRTLPPELRPRVTGLGTCPFCGCGVAGATHHGEAAPPRG